MKEGSMNIELIFSNFSNFEDSLIKQITIEYTKEGEKNFSILLYAKYLFKENSNLWKEAEIVIHNVATYRLHEPLQTTAQVISNGIHRVYFNGLIGLEFGDFADPPETLEELFSSNSFVIGKSISCKLL